MNKLNIKDFLNRGRDNPVIFDSLLNELRDYVPRGSHKASRVYRKCILAGKYKIAMDIDRKYGVNDKHDIVLAMHFSMLVSGHKID